jgi:hypothetical protein
MDVSFSIHERFPWADLTHGILGSVLHPAYQSHGATFPYSSLKDWLHSLRWPPFSAYEFIGDYPEDTSPGWTNNIQGVAHDGSHWFFTQDVRLWRLPVSQDLDQGVSDKDVRTAPIPELLKNKGGNHMGSADVFEGIVYVPLEGTQPPSLLLFEVQTVNFLGYGRMPAQNDAPWCAINPRNRLCYSSHFNSDRLIVYQRNLLFDSSRGIVGADPAHVYDFQLFDRAGASLSVANIQSGAFSPSGHLYLVSDVDNGGLLGFDMTNWTPDVPED